MENGQSSKKTNLAEKVIESEKVHISNITHKIPGPAGIVQAAYELRRKGKEIDENKFIPTQEYIARALVEPQYDESFIMGPWETFRSLGYEEYDCYSTISSIVRGITRRESGRITLVGGIVKSFTTNDLGDAMLELKDETGTISASINRQVLSNSDYSARIVVGDVLVLGDIAYFKPCNNVYLNITPANVKLVISKEGELIEPAADLSLF